MPLVVTGGGETMQAAREQASDRIDDIVVPNLYDRDDIGERWTTATAIGCWRGGISTP